MIRNENTHHSSWAASLYGWTYRSILAPAWERHAQKRPTYDLLALLESTQWCSPEAIERLQIEKLRRLLLYAGAHIPYYRELFAKLRFDPRGIEAREDLAELPLLTREILVERRKDLIDPALHDKAILKAASGAGPKRLVLAFSQESDCWQEAAKLRAHRWAGLSLGLPIFHYWPDTHAGSSRLSRIKRRVDCGLRREEYVDPRDQSEEALHAAVARLRRMRPHLIVGYTQAMAYWARFITDYGLRDWDDIPVICGAEALLPNDRRAIAEAFGSQVYETYGARETMLIGAECGMHEGLHLSEENLLVEIRRAERAARPAETGEVVITDLHNYAMPLIRYQNGDMATVGPAGLCSCGRGLKRLERVDGRRADTLRGLGGIPIPGLMFNVLLGDPSREVLRQFQVVQKASGEVNLKVVKGRDFTESAFATSLARVYSYLRGLPLTVEFLANIPPGPTGKRRTVIVESPAPFTDAHESVLRA